MLTSIRTEQDGAIGTITIDRVNRFNSLDVTTARDLRKAALQFARDDSIRVVILTGAGGFGLAMSCDLVLAADRACFEWAYSKTGLTGAESSTFLLPRMIGLRRALELMLLNPRLTADRALELGLITSVTPATGLHAEVMAVARKLAAGPTDAFGIAKSLLNQAAGIDRLDYHLDQELQHLARCADCPEFQEGIRAFFEKRVAVFHA